MMNIEVENKGKSACQFDLEHKKKSEKKNVWIFTIIWIAIICWEWLYFRCFSRFFNPFFIFNLYIIP